MFMSSVASLDVDQPLFLCVANEISGTLLGITTVRASPNGLYGIVCPM